MRTATAHFHYYFSFYFLCVCFNFLLLFPLYLHGWKKKTGPQQDYFAAVVYFLSFLSFIRFTTSSSFWSCLVLSYTVRVERPSPSISAATNCISA